MLKLFVLLFLTTSVHCNARKPKVYSVNLDTPPQERWNEVIEDHKDHLPALKKIIAQYFDKPWGGIMCWTLEKIAFSFPEEYTKEMEGIAKHSRLEYCEVIWLNILCDITNYNTIIDMAVGPCTSIVAEDAEGNLFHGRNFDYFEEDLFRNMSIIVDFWRDNEVVYTGISFAFFSGLLTGQKPHAFTLSSNGRRTGWYFQNILMQLYTAFRMPLGFGLRQLLEKVTTYDEAREQAIHMPIISPVYLIVAGTKSGEAVLITRDRLASTDVRQLQAKKGRRSIVQTNFDHWNPDEDNRRTTAEVFLEELEHENLDEAAMCSVMDKNPVRNPHTVTQTVMSANSPAMIYRTTVTSE